MHAMSTCARDAQSGEESNHGFIGAAGTDTDAVPKNLPSVDYAAICWVVLLGCLHSAMRHDAAIE